MPKKALLGCTVTLLGRHPVWTQQNQAKVGGWLGNLSGKFSSALSPATTHLVVSQKRWQEEPRPAVIEKALKEKAEGRDLKIVSFDWLEDCLNSQSRKKEAQYEWEKRDAAEAEMQAKAGKAAKKGAAKSAPGMLSEVFHESTDPYVDPVEKRRAEKQYEREREEKKARELAEKEEKMRRRKEQMRLFGKGAKKARNELLSDNYHVYQDSTGFKMDVLVTKVDSIKNKNMRCAITIQIYESNTFPHTYATNAQFAGTALAPANNIVGAWPASFPSALHAFKREFREHTGTEWDERISGHVRRLREERQAPGSTAGSVRGVPVSESRVGEEVPFEKRWFVYHPPGYGPKGEMTDEEKERLVELGLDVVERSGVKKGKTMAPPVHPLDQSEDGDRMAEVEQWVRGADAGGRADSPLCLDPNAIDWTNTSLDTLINGGLTPATGALTPGNGVNIDELLGDYPFATADPQNEEQIHKQQDLNVSADATVETDNEGIEAPPTADAQDGAIADQTQQMTEEDWQAMAQDVNNQNLASSKSDGLEAQSPEQEQVQATDELHVQNGIYDQQDLPFGNGVSATTVEDGPQDLAPGFEDGSQAEVEPQDDEQQGLMSQEELAASWDQQGSFQPAIPSFATNPTITDTLFEHGTQDIGETQVAERAGGEFLEQFAGQGASDEATAEEQMEFELEHEKQLQQLAPEDESQEQQQPTPPASTSKMPKLGGLLDLGGSILGKRKVPEVDEEGDEQNEGGKKQRTEEGGIEI